MKAQFFIVSVIMLSLTLASVVNLVSVPEAVKSTISINEIKFFLDSLSSATENIYSAWDHTLLENRVKIVLNNYECDGGYSTFSQEYDFPDNVIPETISIFGEKQEPAQVVWEDIDTREGLVYWPVQFKECDSKDYYMYYNLVGEGNIETDHEYLIKDYDDGSYITINTTKYRAVVDKSNGRITELYVKGSSSDIVSSIQSVYRCNGTSYNQDGSEIEILESGPIMVSIRVKGNHDVSPRESFTQIMTFLYDRIVIEETTNLLSSIYCSAANDHTYGHLLDPAGGSLQTGNEWVDFDFTGDGIGAVINSSVFASAENSSSESYFNAWDQTTMLGKKTYKLTIIPRWGDETTTSNQSSFLKKLVSETGSSSTKQQIINQQKTALSDAIGRFGYNVFTSSQAQELIQNFTQSPDWYYQSVMDYYIPLSIDKQGYAEFNQNWSKIQGAYPVFLGYIDDNSFRIKRFNSSGDFVDDIVTYSSGLESWFDNMNSSEKWTRESNNTETGISSNGDYLRIYISSDTANSYASYNITANGTGCKNFQIRYKHDSDSTIQIHKKNSSGTFELCTLPKSISFSDHTCLNENELDSIVIEINKTGSADNEIHSLYIDWARLYKHNASIIFNGSENHDYRLYFNTWMNDDGRGIESYGNYNSPDDSINVTPGSVTKKTLFTDSPTTRKVFYLSSDERLFSWPFEHWFELDSDIDGDYIGITDQDNNIMPTQFLEKNGTEYKIGFLSSIENSRKFFLYYDLDQKINFEFKTDLVYNNGSKKAENSYVYWDFDDFVFKFLNSADWFVTDEWMTSNGTHTSYSLSNWEMLKAGPVLVKMKAESLNVKYNITIYAYNPFILVEPWGAQNISFGPVWRCDGTNDTKGYMEQEVSLPKTWDYTDFEKRRYVWFGKRDQNTSVLVFVEKDKTFPSSSTFQAGGNYTYVSVLGGQNPKVYFMPDDFEFWYYEDMQKDLESKARISENIFVFNSILSGQDINIASEKI